MHKHQYSVGRFLNEQSNKIKAKLHGETYMNFIVSICPAGGENEVWVYSDCKCSKADFLGMLIYLMACEL